MGKRGRAAPENLLAKRNLYLVRSLQAGEQSLLRSLMRTAWIRRTTRWRKVDSPQ